MESKAIERALKFVNQAVVSKDLIRHYLNGDGEISNYIIGATMAEHLLELKEKLGGELTEIEQLSKLDHFGENKMKLLIATFEDEYLERLEKKPEERIVRDMAPPRLMVASPHIDRLIIAAIRNAIYQVGRSGQDCAYAWLRMHPLGEDVRVRNRRVTADLKMNPLQFYYSDTPYSFKIELMYFNAQNQFILSSDMAFHELTM